MGKPLLSRRGCLSVSLGLLFTSGCASSWIHWPGRSASLDGLGEDGEPIKETRKLEDILSGADAPVRIGDAVEPLGLDWIKIESVALVNGLIGTGGAPQPSPQREELLSELKTYNVDRPNSVIDSLETAMVTTQVNLPPGVRKGDRLDVFLRISDKANAKSLKGGWLMPTRLRELRVLGDSIRQGDVRAIARGPVLVHQQYSGASDEGELRTGIVLGGAVVNESRTLALRLRSNCQHVMLAAKIAEIINERFYFFDGTRRRGIATAKQDDLVEIDVHPRYRQNVSRLMAVIRQMPIRPNAVDMTTRMDELQLRLSEPTTTEEATFELEALGEVGLEKLREGLQHPSPEHRFYHAQALAYLDAPEAIGPLEELTIIQPAFRFHAIKALGSMDSMLAGDALLRLMQVDSIETRYAAFRALANRADADLTVPGQVMVDGYRLYQIPGEAMPLVVISGVKHAEIVTFGPPQPILPFDSFVVRDGLVARYLPDGQLALSHFRVGHEDKRATASASVPGLLQALVKVEASYGDAVETLRTLKQQSLIPAQLVVDPLPDPQAEFRRPTLQDAEDAEDAKAPPTNITAKPEAPKYRWWDARRYWYD